jgi:Prp8 binding protein
MMPAPKRTASDSFSSSQQLVVKRQKSDANLSSGSAVAVVGNNAQNGALVQSVRYLLPRRNAASPAELKDEDRLMEEMVRSCEPAGCKLRSWNSQVCRTLLRSLTILTFVPGHFGEVFATRFDSTGQHIASGSMDRSICRLPRACHNDCADYKQCCGAPTDNAKTMGA